MERLRVSAIVRMPRRRFNLDDYDGASGIFVLSEFTVSSCFSKRIDHRVGGLVFLLGEFKKPRAVLGRGRMFRLSAFAHWIQ